MKILLTAIYGLQTLGGIETSIMNLSRVLSNKGHEVTLLTFDSSLPKIRQNLNDMVHYNYPVKNDRIGLLFANRLLKTSKEALKDIFGNTWPDQIWSRTIETTYAMTHSKYTGKIIHIPPGTAGIIEKDRWLAFKDFPLYKKIVLFPIYSMNHAFLKDIQKKALLSNKIKIVYYCNMMKSHLHQETGADTKNFISTNPGAKLADEKLPLEILGKIKRPYLFFSGRLTKVKNVSLIIDTLLLLPKLNLVIAGAGILETALKEYAKIKGVGDRVVFLGRVKKGITTLYKNAVVTICPSYYEPFGMVIIESLYCGTPVVALGNNPAFIVAAPEIIIHPENGKIVDENSPEKLAQAIEEVINYPEKEKRKNFNIEYTKSKYSWEKMVDDLLIQGRID